MNAKLVAACRVCGGRDFADVIDLGQQPLANAFLTAEELAAENEVRHPLHALRCASCQLVMLTVVVDPTVMFSRYVYATGFSATMRDHFSRYAEDVQARLVPPGGLVVEIGSNDGTLLAAIDRTGARVLGIEPAANIAKLAEAKGVPTRVAFFAADVARAVAAEHGHASAIIANNVIAHIDDLIGVMAGLDALLAHDGVFVMEAPSLRTFLEARLFDTLYHEHLSVLSAHALVKLAALHGLRVFDVRNTPVHGGSLRVFFDRGWRAPLASVDEELARERAAGVHRADAWAGFRADVTRVLGRLPALLRLERDAGRAVWGYAAPAKGNTLLNAAGIGPDLLPCIVDKSTLKQGLFTPGMHIPVIAPAALERDGAPSALCILAWNLSDEVRGEQAAFAARGGRFMVPLPEPRWLDT